jgi:hypothetical protein
MRFHMVPLYLAELSAKKVTFILFVKQEGKILHHKVVMDRIGCSMDYKVKKYICEYHMFEWAKKYRIIDWNEEKLTQYYYLLVPQAEGMKSNTIEATNTTSKGLGQDRAFARLPTTKVF